MHGRRHICCSKHAIDGFEGEVEQNAGDWLEDHFAAGTRTSAVRFSAKVCSSLQRESKPVDDYECRIPFVVQRMDD